MHRKLTILFAIAFFVLVVGLHADSYACHQKKKPKPHGEETTCNGNGGNGGGGSKEKTLVCHSDCFYWDGFYLEVKNVAAHIAHGDKTIANFDEQVWNDDYCCDDGTIWPFAYEKGCCEVPVPDGKTCEPEFRSPTSE